MATNKNGLLTNRSKTYFKGFGMVLCGIIVMVIVSLLGFAKTWYIPFIGHIHTWVIVGFALVVSPYVLYIPTFNKRYFDFMDMEANAFDIWCPIYNEIATAPTWLKIIDWACVILALITYLLAHLSVSFYTHLFSRMTAVHISSLMTALPIIFIVIYFIASGLSYVIAMLNIRKAMMETINRNKVSTGKVRRGIKWILEQSIVLFTITSMAPFLRIFSINSLYDKLVVLLEKDVHFVYKEDEIERMKLPPQQRGLNSYEMFRDRYDLEDESSDPNATSFGGSEITRGEYFDQNHYSDRNFNNDDWDDRW